MSDYILAGEYRVGRADGVLSILGLGSCVAVILYDQTSQIGGLAHILLPDPSYSSKPERHWRFASTAIPALLAELEAAGADRRRMTARLVGGACMFQDLMPREKVYVGERNVAAARAALARLRIKIVAEEVGGDNGRSLHFNLVDGRIRIARQGAEYVEI